MTPNLDEHDASQTTRRPVSSRVLVVDDDAFVRLNARIMFEQQSVEVFEAQTGEEGLEIFEQICPDLVLLDIILPRLDGNAVCAEMRKLPGGEHIPIIMITSSDTEGLGDISFEAGATDLISKPVPWGVFSHRVRYILNAQEAFKKSRLTDRLGRVLNSTTNEIVIFRADGYGVEQVNSGALYNLGYRAEDVTTLSVFDLLPDLDEAQLTGGLNNLLDGSHEALVLQTDQQRANNSRYPVEIKITYCDTEHPPIFVAVAQDISERVAQEKQIHELAHFDRLTGLANRQLLINSLEQLLERAAQQSYEVALLFIDLKRFKRINDTLGHKLGDELLRLVAGRLEQCMRGNDVVARNIERPIQTVELARIGGDEFIVVLDRLSQGQDAANVAQRVIDIMSQPFVLDQREIFIAPSIGIAAFPEDGVNVVELMKNSAVALTQAKVEDKAAFHFYTNSMNAKALERLELEAKLRYAIYNNELTLHYQPQVDARFGCIVGVEALVRWEHPEKGLVSPAEFIPLAEETGLIVPMGGWVMREACRQLKQWQDDGLPHVQMSINVSGRQFFELGFIDDLEAAISDSGVRAASIDIELTESIIMTNAETAIETLQEIKKMGVKLSVDDFGTGYSSLSYLKRFPLDTLKIDRAFVKDVMADSDDAGIVNAIIAMAKCLKLNLIAEGVEDEGQRDFLCGQECYTIQGFFYSRPVAAEECAKLLANASAFDCKCCCTGADFDI